jgi:hypothetical protein
VDFQRRAGPQPLERHVAALAHQRCYAQVGGQALGIEGERGQRLPLGRIQGAHVVVEAGDRDAAIGVLELSQHAGEREQRVGHDAAPGAGVQVGGGALDVYL